MYEKESEEIIGMCSAVFMHEYLKQDIIELKKKIANKLDLIVSENIQGGWGY